MVAREFSRRLALLIVGLAASFLLAEAALRIYTLFDSPLGRELKGFDPLNVKVQPIGELGYKQRPNVEFSYNTGAKATANSQGYRGPVVPDQKPPGTFRIILLGGSTTHGWGVKDDETIDAFMREELARQFPDRKFDVINLALDGYDSYQLVERLKADGLRFEPDLAIVNTGINDVRNARFSDLKDRDPRTLVWRPVLNRLRAEEERGGPSLWTRIKHHSLLARLPGFVAKTKFQRKEMETAQVARPHDDVLGYFERNLRRIARVARDHGVSLVYSTPPSSLDSNYHPDARPARTYWIVDAATTQRYREKLADRMRSVVRELEEIQPIRYVSQELSADLFIDDAHLTPEGNRQMARAFIEAARPFFETAERTAAPQKGTRDSAWVGGRKE